MYKKIKNLTFLFLFLLSTFFVVKFYISETNIILTNKLRSSYFVTTDSMRLNFPILKNDTENIIEYIDGLQNFKNKRKKRIWESLITNNNE